MEWQLSIHYSCAGQGLKLTLCRLVEFFFCAAHFLWSIPSPLAAWTQNLFSFWTYDYLFSSPSVSFSLSFLFLSFAFIHFSFSFFYFFFFSFSLLLLFLSSCLSQANTMNVSVDKKPVIIRSPYFFPFSQKSSIAVLCLKRIFPEIIFQLFSCSVVVVELQYRLLAALRKEK